MALVISLYFHLMIFLDEIDNEVVTIGDVIIFSKRVSLLAIDDLAIATIFIIRLLFNQFNILN